MSGFTFPPPPPPPPKAAAQDGSPGNPYSSQSGAYGQRGGRGGGERGRGRGRGRGANNRGAFSRGGGHSQGAQQFRAPVLPAGGYINPAFAQQQWNSSMYSNGANTSSSSSQPWSFQSPSMPMNASHVSENLNAGSSRTPNRGRGFLNSSSQRPTNKPKPQAAPAVPSFGFALPSQPGATTAEVNDSGHKNKKRKFNQLGLTPRSDVREDSEDDVDEEAKAAAAGGVLQFEYKGRSATLKSAAEVAAWIEERKKRFPTKARVEEKRKQDDEAREAKRLAQEQAAAERKAKFGDKAEPGKKRKDDEKTKKAMSKIEKLRMKLAKAEAKAERAAAKPNETRKAEPDNKIDAEAVSAPPSNPPKLNLGINYESDEDEDRGASDAESSVVSSSSEEPSSDSDELSSSDSEDEEESDSDAPPDEESSSKRPIRVEPPKRKPVQQEKLPRSARKEVAAGPKRTMSLHDRLVEQERHKEAELALQAIKFLGEKGFFKE
ncbi:uncharacterized protein K452DRAFT_296654 [Aplosporella prunicola CBS 121167]|uniref:FMR1-interacting protein 1 conserved domain-containing protein n=1 Tax=Aplosporella prunicola CBS 121167 TaxID=1176127 RepID=A0A6A6BJT9_9PEZI|nr:uncharacterized protein K452DRAFT_296654 [Aplosporella prunicola CBS 121167]KAF2143653.1 hypothetical protein K452DRAFT_296654 [Aplosporella prunicola CBS 121167]